MHGALGLARRARGEGDQADIVLGGVGRREDLIARLVHQRLERTVSPCHDGRKFRRKPLGCREFADERCVAERQRDLRLADRIGEFAGTQHRHGRDDDPAGFQHGEIGRDHHRRVGGAQQDAIARHEAEIASQRIGDAVHHLGERRIAPDTVRRDHRIALAMPRRDMAIDELGDDVEALRIVQPCGGEVEARPAFARRQVVPRERVHMSRPQEICGIHLVPLALLAVTSAGRGRSRPSAPRSRPRRS